MSLFDRINAAVEARSSRDERPVDLGSFRSISNAVNPTEGWVPPVPPEKISPYGYQLAAAESTLKYRRVVLGFSPGLGKTAIALMVIAAEVKKGGRAVVVVPPSLRLNWLQEAEKFYPNLRVEVVDGRKAEPFDISNDVVIIGDSVVSSRKDDIIEYLSESKRPVLIIDEAQRHKSLGDWNKPAQRSAAMVTIVDSLPTKAVIMSLTGTLVVNRAHEVYGPVRLVGKRLASQVNEGTASKATFWNRWVVYSEFLARGRVVRQVTGSVDPDALHEKLRQTCYIRVERQDVLDMPDKVWVVRNLALGSEMKEYRLMERNFLKWVRENRGEVAARKAERAEAITRLMGLWEEAGKAKVSATVEYVEQLVQQGEQVVVMAHHRSVVQALTDALNDAGIKSVRIMGGMADKAKDTSVRAFKGGEVDVLVGNITAAGTGLNLENAHHLVFMQLSWSPGELIQASDRIYRVTQRHDCTIHILNAARTIDETLWNAIGDKVQTADLINAGTLGSLLDTTETRDVVLAKVLETKRNHK